MLLSKSCIYGLRASLYLASRQSQDYIPIRKMSDDLEISFHFLTKILQQLTAESLLESFKGPNGGVRLKKSGEEITFMDIVVAIDGPGLFTECALGLPGCGVQKPCPFHEEWAKTRDKIKEMMENTSIMNLAVKGKEENLRLTAEGGFEKFFDLE